MWKRDQILKFSYVNGNFSLTAQKNNFSMSIDQIMTELGVRTVTNMVDFYKTAIARNDLY